MPLLPLRNHRILSVHAFHHTHNRKWKGRQYGTSNLQLFPLPRVRGWHHAFEVPFLVMAVVGLHQKVFEIALLIAAYAVEYFFAQPVLPAYYVCFSDHGPSIRPDDDTVYQRNTEPMISFRGPNSGKFSMISRWASPRVLSAWCPRLFPNASVRNSWAKDAPRSSCLRRRSIIISCCCCCRLVLFIEKY